MPSTVVSRPGTSTSRTTTSASRFVASWSSTTSNTVGRAFWPSRLLPMGGTNDHLFNSRPGAGHPLGARSLPTYRPRAEPVGGGTSSGRYSPRRHPLADLRRPIRPLRLARIADTSAVVARRRNLSGPQSVHTFVLGRGANAAVMARARAICDRCPVRPECLAFALADPGTRLGYGPVRRAPSAD